MARVLTDEDTLSSQSKSLKKESTILDKLVYVELGLGIILTLGGLGYYFLANSVGWLIFGVIVLFLALSHKLKKKENKANMGKINSGRSGEQFVSKLLRQDLPEDCYILNDIDVSDGRRSAQNDHIVLSPAGLFVIETKAYSGTLSGHAEDDNWTQIKEKNNSKSKHRLTNPIQQNEYHVEVIRKFLENNELAIQPEDVYSYVAMVNKYMTLDVEGDTSNVDMAWVVTDKIEKKLDSDKYSKEEMAEFLRALKIQPPEELS
ncbi:MAG: nuclease-related domain-containing protein [bacterium]